MELHGLHWCHKSSYRGLEDRQIVLCGSPCNIGKSVHFMVGCEWLMSKCCCLCCLICKLRTLHGNIHEIFSCILLLHLLRLLCRHARIECLRWLGDGRH